MLRPKSLILLALALGCGLAASIGISRVMDANANRGPAEVDSTPIYIARHNINLGDPIDQTMVTLQEFPTSLAPEGAITSLEDLEGRRPRTAIVAGTPILDAQLLALGESSDPITGIPPEYRLATISVNAEKSAAGLLSPGDRVDVQLFVQANPRAGVPTATSKVILQNIRVFAVEQAVQRAAEGEEGKAIPKTVSLLVKPDQAQRINLAQNLGELSLIPRNPNDETEAAVSEVTVADLLGTRSEINDRVGEQNRGDAIETKGKGLLNTVVGMMARAAKERPPFEMTIIQSEAVSTMRFDPRTGKPLDGEHSSYQSRPTAEPASFRRPSRADTDVEEAVAEAIEEDFPINFGEE